MKRIILDMEDTIYELLEVLTHGTGAPESVEAVIGELIDHARQGVYRPGAWERDWLIQAFGGDWIPYLEPGDPYGRNDCERIFQRPRKPQPPRRREP